MQEVPPPRGSLGERVGGFGLPHPPGALGIRTLRSRAFLSPGS